MHYRLYGAIATALASAAAFAQTTSLHRVAGFGGDTTSASILNGGASIGTSMRVVNGSMKGQRAYIATALGTSEVGTLSTSSTGQGSSGIQLFNGTIATGVYQVYSGSSTSSAQLRAFRYVAGSQTSHDLGDFGLQGSNLTPTATLINAVRGSEIIGAMSKHTSVANLGLRAFRSYSDGSLVDLGTLGTSSTGVGSSTAHVFSNDGSTVYGVSTKYVSNVNQGSKAFYAVAGQQMRELVTPTTSLSISGRLKVLANGKIAATTTNGRLLVWAGNSSSALEQTIGTGASISHTDSASNMFIRTGTSIFSSWLVGNQSLTPIRIGSSTASVRVTAVGNAAGRVVGESVYTPQQTLAFRFSIVNGYEDLGHLGATSSGLTYSSAKLELDNGLVVGDSRLGNFGMRGFYWESGVGMQSIGSLGTTSDGYGFSTISGKLNFNQVYGQSDLYVNGVGQGRRAIVWSKFAGLRYVGDLFSADDSAGWVFTLITGASADGWVTGYGVKDGIRQAYRFQMQFMTPEPSTMIGLAVGGLALLRRKRK